MKIILTGGAGFIGSVILWKLNLNGYSDIIIVDQPDKSGKEKNLEGKKYKDYLDKDEFLEQLCANKFKGSADMVIHMGACSSTTVFDMDYMKKNNYLYSRQLCQWALKNEVYFLYASSAATYGDGSLGYSDEDSVTLKLKPLNPYAISKQLFDAWIIENKLQDKVCGFKFFNVFGPNEYHKGDMRRVALKAYEQIQKEGKVSLFKSYREEYADGQQKRDFIYVKDAAEVVYHFIQHPDLRGIFNLGTGQARTWNDLVLALFKALKRQAKIEYIEMPENIRDKYQYFTQAEMSKLRQCGYQDAFLSLEESVNDYAGYLKRHACL